MVGLNPSKAGRGAKNIFSPSKNIVVNPPEFFSFTTTFWVCDSSNMSARMTIDLITVTANTIEDDIDGVWIRNWGSQS